MLSPFECSIGLMKMFKTIDITPYGRQKVSFYLAMERYFLNSRQWADENLFFIWDIFPAIVCGKHQLIPNEVNLDYASRIGVPYYRRHSGGGTIFADEGCFMFTFIRRSTTRDKVFAESLAEIVRALGELGVDAEISGRNDLIFRGKKFSGNAYFRNDKGSILHGTLLYKTDVEKMVRAITPDNEKLISKGIESVRQRVINLGDFLDVSREELMRHLERSIASERIVIDDEIFNAISAIEPEYLSAEWQEGNNPPYTYVNKIRFDYGLVQAAVDVRKGLINGITLTGDFFTHTDLAPLYSALTGIPFTAEAVSAVLRQHPMSSYILGADNKDLLALFEV